jgi:di/tricarboxylate transporter
MILSWLAIGIFVAIFALATLRKVHLGIIMLPAACGVGVWLAGMSLRDILAGFPVSIMVLLVGVTYFFGIAQVNGTVDRLIEAVLARVGQRAFVMPGVFFGLTAMVSAMGSPLAGLVIAPIGMPLARRYGMDPMLMAIAIGCGFSAGAFAPTSLFGIVSYGTARQAGIELNPLTLFAVAGAVNAVLLISAYLIFGGRSLLLRRNAIMPPHEPSRPPLARNQVVTIACLVGLVVTIVASGLAGLEPDIGVLCFAFGAALTLTDPRSGGAAVSRIDWSTVLLVGGIITFVGVLQTMGSVERLAQAAGKAGTPIVAALVICIIGALVSAFASTTGILAALVPLALPLVASGGVPGWAMISALAVCSSIVDVSPYSTVGATLVATSDPEDRPRVTSLLMRWGMAMVILGPVVLVGLLVLPAVCRPGNFRVIYRITLSCIARHRFQRKAQADPAIRDAKGQGPGDRARRLALYAVAKLLDDRPLTPTAVSR